MSGQQPYNPITPTITDDGMLPVVDDVEREVLVDHGKKKKKIVTSKIIICVVIVLIICIIVVGVYYYVYCLDKGLVSPIVPTASPIVPTASPPTPTPTPTPPTPTPTPTPTQTPTTPTPPTQTPPPTPLPTPPTVSPLLTLHTYIKPYVDNTTSNLSPIQESDDISIEIIDDDYKSDNGSASSNDTNGDVIHNMCDFELVSGKRKGMRCDRRCVGDKYRCTRHIINN